MDHVYSAEMESQRWLKDTLNWVKLPKKKDITMISFLFFSSVRDFRLEIKTKFDGKKKLSTMKQNLIIGQFILITLSFPHGKRFQSFPSSINLSFNL